MTPRRWLITGVSSGLGREVARAALAAGDQVAGAVRREVDRGAFEALAPGHAMGLIMDLTDEAAVRAAVAQAERRMGRIDVLVNNAGFGLIGAVEEVSLAEARAQFDVNLFGTMAVIQAVLPGMRARRAGRILTITSVSGLAAWGGTAVYCASKFALEGLTQALAQEVAGLGISVTNIAPGGLRTDYAGRSLRFADRVIDDYDAVAGFARRVLTEGAGRESGDPVRAAAAILAISQAQDPPLHLLLGHDAVHYATRAAGRFQTELGDWIALTSSISIDDKAP